jgi:tetratricopeptide (TPR) repeat protein
VDHPTRDDLRRFVLTTLPEEADVEIERHLEGTGDLPGCETCLYAARELTPAADLAQEDGIAAFAEILYGDDDEGAAADDEGGHALADVLARALRRRFLVDREAALAPGLIEELDRRPPALRREVVRTARRYQLLGFAEALSERSREAGFLDPGRALELAELAVEVADVLDPRLYHPKLVADRQALARASVGNARRVASDLFGADRAFHEASALLALGSRAEVPRADLASLLASLRIDQARYPEARRLLEEARETYEAWQEPESVGRVLLKLGLAAGYSGEADEAVKLFTRAAKLLAAATDGRPVLQAHHNLANWLLERGDPLEALARFREALPLYERFDREPSSRLRRRWLEGKIHAGLGDLETARAAFEEVRAEATRRELGYELAMVSLELAILHLERGDSAAVRRLAGELVPAFHSRDLHRHALGALYLFQHAAQAETVTAAFTRDLLRYLQRARNNPYLRFELGGR